MKVVPNLFPFINILSIYCNYEPHHTSRCKTKEHYIINRGIVCRTHVTKNLTNIINHEVTLISSIKIIVQYTYN